MYIVLIILEITGFILFAYGLLGAFFKAFEDDLPSTEIWSTKYIFRYPKRVVIGILGLILLMIGILY